MATRAAWQSWNNHQPRTLQPTMPPEIYVISLPGSVERRQHITRQLAAAGLPFGFFDGIDGRKDDHVINRYYDEGLRLRRKGAPLSAGQLGCFASHHAMWQKCLDDNRTIIVLEDDLEIDGDRLNAFYQQADQLPASLECIRLFDNRTRAHGSIPISRFGGFTVFKYTKGPMSGMGYLLTPAGAAKLLAHTQPVYFAVDIHMDRFWAHKMECYGIRPPCISHRDDFDSTIGYDRDRKRRTLKEKILREAFNITEKVRRFLHNLSFRLRHRK
jgi:glycosyl transferase, family 25